MTLLLTTENYMKRTPKEYYDAFKNHISSVIWMAKNYNGEWFGYCSEPELDLQNGRWVTDDFLKGNYDTWHPIPIDLSFDGDWYESLHYKGRIFNTINQEFNIDILAHKLNEQQEAIDCLTKSLGEAHSKIIELQDEDAPTTQGRLYSIDKKLVQLENENTATRKYFYEKFDYIFEIVKYNAKSTITDLLNLKNKFDKQQEAIDCLTKSLGEAHSKIIELQQTLESYQK